MNRSRSSRRYGVLPLALLAALALAGAPDVAAAQDDAGLQPPTIRLETKRGGGFYIQVGLVIVMTAAVIGANTIPSKRGHQD